MLKHLLNRPKSRTSFNCVELTFQQLEPRQLLAVTDLTMVTYNALNFGTESADRQDEFQVVFQELNADVVVMQEVTSETGADILLNAINAEGQYYARADFVDGNDTDHILFYNTLKIELVAQNYIPTTLREIGEYTLSVDGTQFNVYSTHLKASSGGTNEQRRLDEVTVLREHLETLPSDMEFIVAGDMNMYGSSEPAYQKLIASESNNAGRLVDLLPAEFIGEWHNNASFAAVHTQSTRTASFGGGATGGMDDRFDMIFANFGINDGLGLEYVPNSYFTLGNDGEHFNLSILDGSNNSASPAVIQALHDASDHLPVVTSFQVITDSIAGITVTETNNSTAVAEGGISDSYQLVLDSIPQANVSIEIAPDGQIDLGAGAGNAINLLFTPENALSPQTIDVTAFDDSIEEGTHAGLIRHSVASSDSNYDGFSIADLVVSIADNDSVTANFLFNEIYVNNPGRDSNFEYVEIATSPFTSLADVWLLEIDGDGSNAGVIDNAQNLGSLTAGSNGLVLLGANYASTGTPWGGLVNPATTLADLSGGTMENGTISFLLVRGFSGSNQMDLDSNNDGQLDLTPWGSMLDSVGWTDGDQQDHVYSSAQLSQSGTPDAASRFPDDLRNETTDAWFNGDISGSSNSTTFSQGSNNLPDGALITPGEVNFGGSTLTPGVTVLESGGNTLLTEGGADDSWTVVLNSVPASNVTIVVRPDEQTNLGAGAGVPIELSFTPTNALTPQTVVAEAFDDAIAEGTHSAIIAQSSTSNDVDYDGLNIPGINVSITDNDTAGVLVTESGDSTDVTEGGNNDSYTIGLQSEPTDEVTIVITPDGQLDLGSGIGIAIQLVFSPENASVPQTITVIAADDAAVEGFHTGGITHVLASTDARYDGIEVPSVAVGISDNDANNLTKFFVVDHSVDDTFKYGADGSLVENHDLATGNTAPRGVATDAAGTTVWVIDNDDRVYLYDSAGNPLGNWFAEGLLSPEGIATNGTDIWITDRRLDRVFYFANGALATSGSYSATSSFALPRGNRNPQGITTDGNFLWVVNAAGKRDRVFKYTINGNLLGSWTLPSSNASPSGITIDPNDVNDIWIVDRATDQVFQYYDAAHRISGTAAADVIWNLTAQNTDPRGIADPLAINPLRKTDASTLESSDISPDLATHYFDRPIQVRGEVGFNAQALLNSPDLPPEIQTESLLLRPSSTTERPEWGLLDGIFANQSLPTDGHSSEGLISIDDFFEALDLEFQVTGEAGA